jgi:hypothetical protein
MLISDCENSLSSYGSLQPFGQVPALQDGDLYIFGMMLSLNDIFSFPSLINKTMKRHDSLYIVFVIVSAVVDAVVALFSIF